MSMFPAGRRFPSRARLGGWLLSGAMLLGLPGCQTSPPSTSRPPIPPPAAKLEIPPGARVYDVVPEESLLQILVYRGGAMARLGHNHVIASRMLDGKVYDTGDPTRARFDIRFPVNGLTVDEPALREEAGPDFPAGVPQSARDGTRKNLLSTALLDGANYPEIRLRATDVKAGADVLDVGVEIIFKDRAYPLRVPVHLERRDGEIVASGEFALRQSELGLEPFSAGLGTLTVLDEMRIRFAVTAR